MQMTTPSKRSSPLRIAHVISTPAGVGGAELTLSQLVRYGGNHGWDQLVLNPFALDPADQGPHELYLPATYEGRVAKGWMSLPLLRRWLAERLDAFRPDIIHAHLFHASVLVASIRRRSGPKLVLSHQHGNHFQATGAGTRELFDRLAGRRYDRIVGCSRSVEDYLVYRHGYPVHQVCHVYNGWSGTPVERRNGGEPSIICVARFRPEKNHETLIDAVALVRERVPDVRLRLVGDGETRPAVEARVRDAGLDGNVDFLGRTADVWPLLAQARVFALTTTHEALGIAALEAMAAGLPVVTTAVGGLREIVDDGETGFLFPPRQPAELAKHLARLLTDDELAANMGERARQVAQRYRADRTAEGYANVYSQLLRGRNG
jgi:glycosyltransferase involved in cell wall biosynthesis